MPSWRILALDVTRLLRSCGARIGVLAACVAFAAAILLAGGSTQAGAASGLTLQSVHANAPASTFSPTWTYTDDPGGTASWETPTWLSTYSFPIPSSIPAGGVTFTITITAEIKSTAPPNTTLVPAMGLGGELVKGGNVAINTTADPSVGKNPSSASAQVTLVPDGTSPVVLTVGLQDGPTFTYTYVSQVASLPPPVAPSPAVVVPTPSGFDQTVTAAEPPPGGTAVITSPALALAGGVTAPSAVTVDVSGLSVRDHVIAAARHECYVNFTKAVFNALRKIKQKLVELDWDRMFERFAGIVIAHLTVELAACVEFVNAMDQVFGAQGTAGVAQASCGVSPIALSIGGSGSATRLRSFNLGNAKDTHQPLRLSCTPQAGKLTITVATQSARTPLSAIVGSRLQLGVVRSPSDSAGGQLSVTFHHS
jgi:hypothetical protein